MQQFQAYVSYEYKYNKNSTQMKHKISIKVNWDCKKKTKLLVSWNKHSNSNEYDKNHKVTFPILYMVSPPDNLFASVFVSLWYLLFKIIILNPEEKLCML